MFCFDACSDNQSLRSNIVTPASDATQATNISGAAEQNGGHGVPPGKGSSPQNKEITFQVGDTIELLEKSKNQNYYTLTFKKGSEKIQARVPIKPDQKSIRALEDGSGLGNLDGHPLRLYVFWGDAENNTEKGQIYFRVSTDGFVRDRGDFMTFKIDSFKSGIIEKENLYGGIYRIFPDSITTY